ncbi:AAA family ATPase [Methylovulum psychrotolerans]|uniref:Endonuclease GajA/Old nuclease/RecF-like AAA domain-containing protein n=1 Tax=Methylovulum psychrotolerans TaxID=1704499 RepID=A0A2S5CJ69_9GAMM|nr:AAA family ATPase [Methylovulum psychrotolerans]POZ50850.1 hypothetical protein AADEFJLK_03322 [Methylovulum psychrotolerans]
MKLEVSVKNLGQIKEANFHIRPITVITGPNGTGKSFFTKSLYSILNVVNRNVYHENIIDTIQDIRFQFDVLVDNADANVAIANKIKSELLQLQTEFEKASRWKINDYFSFAVSKTKSVDAIDESYRSTFLLEPKEGISLGISARIKDLLITLVNCRTVYIDFLNVHVKDELLESFQVAALSELTRFGEKQIEVRIDDFFAMEISEERLLIDIGTSLIDDFVMLSSVVFFESPAYWKVRDALKSAKNNPNRPPLMGRKNDDILTGVPKYFYDLDIALNTRTKTEGTFKSATDLLTHTLGGEFIFKGDELSFKDKNGREISKNLMSFGMTNLGMIQALLKYNIITAGSFIFIDEPETNLHPDWQVKLVDVLLLLAQGGVNIVITTHSSDLVKALEVKIKKLEIDVMEDFLSVHFLGTDGKLLEFESKDSLQQIIEARELLSLAYQQLYFSDL